MRAPERPRARLPERVDAGEIVTIRALVSHPMHNGLHLDSEGRAIPRDLVHGFRCELDGELVFACELGPSVSENPYLTFTARVEASGTFRLVWSADDGSEAVLERDVVVRGAGEGEGGIDGAASARGDGA